MEGLADLAAQPFLRRLRHPLRRPRHPRRPGIRVDRAEQLTEAFKTALASDGPALVEVMTDPLLT